VCGIAGVFDPRGETSADELDWQATTMAMALQHRGPDDAGSWVDQSAGIAFGHRRLEIVGLGPQGHQPMQSPSRRWTVNYNGEIYNVGALRARLVDSGVRLIGSSDTEVLVTCLDQWGLERTVDLAEGMFAFGAWDAASRRLHLLRDRFGEKPLYYGWVGHHFVFASELKAIRRLPGFKADVDRQVVAQFLGASCVPAPACIYSGFAKLSPGAMVSVDGGARPGHLPDQVKYWSADFAIDTSRGLPPFGDLVTMTDYVEKVLSDSVAARLIAEMPVGALLSGGIDSSLIVALMQRHSPDPVRTFTVSFVEEAFDESSSAAAVAAHLKTDHVAVEMTQGDVFDRIPRLPEIWDEPFGDSSQLPTLLVAEIAKRSVSVALSGDGGDELFAGYNRHAWLGRLWRAAAPFPPIVRRGVGGLLGRIPPYAVTSAGSVLPQGWRVRLPSSKVSKLGRVLQSPSVAQAYTALTSHWEDPSALVLGHEIHSVAHHLAPSGRPSIQSRNEITDQLLRSDLAAFLPDDVLTKVDRAAMAVSLETRAPFLDRAVFDAAWRVPSNLKVHEGQGKWVLRQILDRYVPRTLIDRPKMGFGLPIDAWLRQGLRPWAEDLLSMGSLTRYGLLDPKPIRRAWGVHLSGRRDLGYELWDVLMLQAFMDRWCGVGQ
jgi:asparagine synthase (glutamine-hydrolysing)